ncbi:MAG: hypothetical protein DPW16_00405 [Chloroflexi bacterium]|nr:hypothetical protein [Chloroflexota bacterium]
MAVPVILRNHQREIQTINPDEHIVHYRPTAWAARFGDDPDYQYLNQRYPVGVSRGQIAQLVTNVAIGNLEFSRLRKTFLVAMMWGYGTVGYGPYRTQIMLNSLNVETILTDTYSLLKSGKVVEAYDQFHVDRCGPAFFTKFFYFVGLGLKLKPLPLILDSVVARSLSHPDMIGEDIKELASITNGSVGRYAEGYQKYLTLVERWAKELECRPDAIEYFLFNWTGN